MNCKCGNKMSLQFFPTESKVPPINICPKCGHNLELAREMTRLTMYGP